MAVTLLGPPAATAQEDEVYVNPDSPSGVEYDLPLERARRNSDPSDPASVAGSREPSTVPFGEGIGPDEGVTSASESSVDGDGDRSPQRKARDASRDREARNADRRDKPLPPEVVAAAAQPVAPADTIGSTLAYAGLGALVVITGGLAGLLLRRRRGGG